MHCRNKKKLPVGIMAKMIIFGCASRVSVTAPALKYDQASFPVYHVRTRKTIIHRKEVMMFRVAFVFGLTRLITKSILMCLSLAKSQAPPRNVM